MQQIRVRAQVYQIRAGVRRSREETITLMRQADIPLRPHRALRPQKRARKIERSATPEMTTSGTAAWSRENRPLGGSTYRAAWQASHGVCIYAPAGAQCVA